MVLNTSDPAIQAFKKKGISASAAPNELLKAVSGLKIPVLDISRLASELGKAKLLFVVDDEEKLWYSITREFTNPNIAITVSSDLRIQTQMKDFSGRPVAKDEIKPAVKSVANEDFIAAQIILYRFPNIPYVIDVECTPSSRALCSDKRFLSRISRDVELISSP
jgi:hypothetical protein